MTPYVLPWFLILDPLSLLQCLFTELHKLQNMLQADLMLPTGYLKQKERLEKHKGQGGYTAVGTLIQMIQGLSLYTTM